MRTSAYFLSPCQTCSATGVWEWLWRVLLVIRHPANSSVVCGCAQQKAAAQLLHNGLQHERHLKFLLSIIIQSQNYTRFLSWHGNWFVEKKNIGHHTRFWMPGFNSTWHDEVPAGGPWLIDTLLSSGCSCMGKGQAYHQENPGKHLGIVVQSIPNP